MSTDQLPATTEPKRAPLVVEDESALGYMMDTAKFEHCYRIASGMAKMSLLPKHLRIDSRSKQELPLDRVAANCFRVVNQSLRWGMDPYSIIDSTYAVDDKLGYEGKLVAAVVNSRAGLDGRLNYTFSGQGDSRTVTVSGRFAGEEEPRTISLSVAQAKTSNQMWTKDPDQKLVYSGVTKWARRHCPEVMLGVLTDDDIERMREAAVKTARPGPDSLDALADRLMGTEEKAEAEEPAGEAEQPQPTDEEPEPDEPADPLEWVRLLLDGAANGPECDAVDAQIKAEFEGGRLTAELLGTALELVGARREGLKGSSRRRKTA